MQILVINNDRGGFASHIDVADGTTVQQLVAQQIKSRRPEDYLIRVNRQPCPPEQILQPRDRVSITPVKIEGARNPSAAYNRAQGARPQFAAVS